MQNTSGPVISFSLQQSTNRELNIPKDQQTCYYARNFGALSYGGYQASMSLNDFQGRLTFTIPHLCYPTGKLGEPSFQNWGSLRRLNPR